MKHLFHTIVFSFCTLLSFAQPEKFTGTWEGDLDAGIQKLRLVFSISAKAGSYTASMQSPQQSAAYMPADTIILRGDSAWLEMKKYRISFSGRLINDSSISGEFVQGMTFPLQLKKVNKASAVTKPKRPQTPKPPFPYKSIDVSFSNKDQSLRFGGTLTLPDTVAGKKYPAAILISGSGPQDRDETLFGHKPFAVIADHLTRQGIAVLRVDDRGVAKSTGNFSEATSADFADDAESALNYLQQHAFIDKKNIGFIGHSEGGQVAPVVASRRRDVKFIVLLAGPGIPRSELLAEQNVAIFKSNGMEASMADAYGIVFKKMTAAILNAKDSAAAVAAITGILTDWEAPDPVKKVFKVENRTNAGVFAKEMVDRMYNPWFRYFLSYDPAPALKKLSCAVLALNGSKDVQVLPQSNLAGIKNALQKSKAKNYDVKEVPGLNHLFQACQTCTLDEYSTLEESFSPAALDIMTAWLLKQVQ